VENNNVDDVKHIARW